MCGIVVIRNFASAQHVERQGLRSLGAIAHRGPDHKGWSMETSATSQLFMGHQRLSILDPTPAANQPLTCNATGNVLIFNGEIYNFLELRAELSRLGEVFTSDSDSEVVLKGWRVWKEGVFGRLNGMWALAIHDKKSGDLILCRDRMGVKPLYYHFDGKQFLAASEVRAIAAALGAYPRTNPRAIFEFLLTGYADHQAETFFEDIVVVPPSVLLRISPTGRISHRLYHVWPEKGSRQASSPEEIRALLEDSVRLRLRADVPVMTLLSSGLDSSIVTAIAAKAQGPRISFAGAFTYGYLHHADNDETAAARSFLKQIAPNTNHHTHQVDEASPSFEELLKLTRAQNEPFNTPSILAAFRTYDLLSKQGIKVVLSSEGADEIFGGYPHPFQALKFRDLLRRFDLPGVGRMISLGSTSPSQLANTMIWAAPQSVVRALLRQFRPSASLIQPDFWTGQGSQFEQIYDIRQLSAERFMRGSVLHHGLPHILRMADRNSMRAGVEVRSPFLDYRLVEAGLTLPIEGKLEHGFTKVALRSAARGILPDDIAWKRKTLGFGHIEQFLISRFPLDAMWERLQETQAHSMISIPRLRALLAQPSHHPTLWWAISVLLWLVCVAEEDRALKQNHVGT